MDGCRFLLDRSVGGRLLIARLASGWDAVTLAEQFGDERAQRMADEEWIAAGTRAGFVLLAKDHRIASRPLEALAVHVNDARVVTFARGELTAAQMGTSACCTSPRSTGSHGAAPVRDGAHRGWAAPETAQRSLTRGQRWLRSSAHRRQRLAPRTPPHRRAGEPSTSTSSRARTRVPHRRHGRPARPTTQCRSPRRSTRSSPGRRPARSPSAAASGEPCRGVSGRRRRRRAGPGAGRARSRARSPRGSEARDPALVEEDRPDRRVRVARAPADRFVMSKSSCSRSGRGTRRRGAPPRWTSSRPAGRCPTPSGRRRARVAPERHGPRGAAAVAPEPSRSTSPASACACAGWCRRRSGSAGACRAWRDRRPAAHGRRTRRPVRCELAGSDPSTVDRAETSSQSVDGVTLGHAGRIRPTTDTGPGRRRASVDDLRAVPLHRRQPLSPRLARSGVNRVQSWTSRTTRNGAVERYERVGLPGNFLSVTFGSSSKTPVGSTS